ncbi:MAG: hypothetical protein VKL39_22800, partial [Leptolyngbyaceae bacterium]|nr:hypothetical protein [Leptolyngbyaceae bacterium]
VCFTDNQFKHQSDLESLCEWSAYKTHWIAPVLGGVPIRVYNALSTGGVAILPSFYHALPEGNQFTKQCIFYETSDVIDPKNIVQEAVDIFDSIPYSLHLDLISSSIEKFHIDSRIERILLAVELKFQNFCT